MRTLENIVQDLREHISKSFETVRISSLQTPEQFMQEVKAINPDRLPGVIIVFDAMNFLSESSISEFSLTLVLVDRFRAAADVRALSVFRSAGALLDLFPPEGFSLNNVHVHPVDCTASSPDALYAVMALGIKCKQGF